MQYKKEQTEFFSMTYTTKGHQSVSDISKLY